MHLLNKLLRNDNPMEPHRPGICRINTTIAQTMAINKHLFIKMLLNHVIL